MSCICSAIPEVIKGNRIDCMTLYMYTYMYRCILSPENICFWGARSRNISTIFVGTFGGLAPPPNTKKLATLVAWREDTWTFM